jgi:hypothetical protein
MCKEFLKCIFQMVCNEHTWGQDPTRARSRVARYVPETLIVLIHCTKYHDIMLHILEVCSSDFLQTIG